MFGIVYGSDSDNKIMNCFVDEYELWCNEGKNPDIASIDLDFALDLQKKRLDEKGVKIQTAFTDKETVKNEVPINACTAYDMGECKSNIASKTYEVTEKYFKDGKKKKKTQDASLLCNNVTPKEPQGRFDYLNDMDFLIALDKLNIKTHYAKIILLSFDEKPIREI